MIKGLYSAASAMLAEMNQQTLLAHNVANLDTPGFRQMLSSLTEYEQTNSVEPHLELSLQQRLHLIGTVGLGVLTTPEKIDFTPGALRFTGEPLDFAISGAGFFRVETPDGEQYTRDGRFNLNTEGELVTVDGYYVLDDSGQPITLTGEGTLTSAGDGSLFWNGEAVAKLGLASFSDPTAQLTHGAANTFVSDDEPDGEELGTVGQTYLEAANVNSAEVMTQMVQVARHYEAAQRMVQTQDSLAGQTISSLGRF
jgi:flagellar basal body rod protein FlgG